MSVYLARTAIESLGNWKNGERSFRVVCSAGVVIGQQIKEDCTRACFAVVRGLEVETSGDHFRCDGF